MAYGFSDGSPIGPVFLRRNDDAQFSSGRASAAVAALWSMRPHLRLGPGANPAYAAARQAGTIGGGSPRVISSSSASADPALPAAESITINIKRRAVYAAKAKGNKNANAWNPMRSPPGCQAVAGTVGEANKIPRARRQLAGPAPARRRSATPHALPLVLCGLHKTNPSPC